MRFIYTSLRDLPENGNLEEQPEERFRAIYVTKGGVLGLPWGQTGGFLGLSDAKDNGQSSGAADFPGNCSVGG